MFMPIAYSHMMFLFLLYSFQCRQCWNVQVCSALVDRKFIHIVVWCFLYPPRISFQVVHIYWSIAKWFGSFPYLLLINPITWEVNVILIFPHYYAVCVLTSDRDPSLAFVNYLFLICILALPIDASGPMFLFGILVDYCVQWKGWRVTDFISLNYSYILFN